MMEIEEVLEELENIINNQYCLGLLAGIKPRVEKLQTENKELREWVKKANHHGECPMKLGSGKFGKCTCGLDKLLTGE